MDGIKANDNEESLLSLNSRIDRAIEAGLDDDYQLTYSPTSTVLHGMWNSLAQMNLRRCINPLHRFHFVPNMFAPPLLLEPLHQATQIMDESLGAWSKSMRVSREQPTALERFIKRLDELAQEQSSGTERSPHDDTRA